ncbi:MAG TPA: chromate transporter [Candidatus Eisenbergiella merdipullorum]|uniref:Chromate transporter n=1 Tax=Candidatus Eisenbergiella merdipullorum TaxID=2838553 RepID=A0A9D2I984_9FIRM|nr:chromate transporter [Candidatus Eisenbergiella merdipullorum]
MKSKKEVLRKLFISTLYLSAFTFGGGYVIVTLMKKKFVDEYHWIEENEMLDLIAIAQSAPGAIAVNGAIVVGYKLAGMVGAVTAIIATIIPPFLIISVISVFYNAFRENFVISQLLEGMQAGVGAVIAAVVYEMAAGIIHGRSPISIGIMLAAFVATCFFGVNVVYVVLVCILFGIVRTLVEKKTGHVEREEMK